MKQIYIDGHSGCNLEIYNNTILKTTTNDSYRHRLRKQCQKQKFFKKQKMSNIIIPEIISENWDNSVRKFGFSMQYFYANDFINFFESNSICYLKDKIRLIISFIEYNIATSKLTKINKQVFLKKYYDVKNTILNHRFYSDNTFKYIFDSFEEEFYQLQNVLEIPIGQCHGDLTFSNILFLKNDIVLIDFLDNFLETPLQDIVKIRQDTKHKWSLLLIKKEYDKIKINLILDFFDSIIDNYFNKYKFYKTYYSIFAKINLMRIIPYVKQEKIFDYLIQEFKSL
ncbi:hypothetical protein H2250_07355 [Campylobacter sp. RM3125]|uniref:hypothetical protein n=1 Tax=Campylobacter molothri TaxID=1032242 RepID=UPI00301DCBA3|nr:hypothetical protein [Campylobacter sp. RM3125]MBZ7972282.1 hypothetical protein [Campylobacter sp. RM3124]